MSRRKLIEATVSDLVGKLLYYDRKDDEELGKGEIEAAIAAEEISPSDIVEHFASELNKHVGGAVPPFSADFRLIKGLLDFLPCCRNCEKSATKKTPTAELGYFLYFCDEHASPGYAEEGDEQGPFDLPQADIVRTANERLKRNA